MNGGRFDFDDGGTYCGGWEDGKAHGHGVCTGPKGQGEYSGAWHYGFEVSGVYTWPSGNTYDGQWQNGKRHGLGIERRGRWIYRGEWTQGYKGRYGIRHSTNSQAKYEGTWASGLQDGYGVETYADGGTYQGQWLRGMRHGYGVRRSAPYGVAAKYRSRSHAHASLTSLRSDQGDEGADKENKKADDSRGGFVLRARSEPPSRRRSLSERSMAVKKTILQGLRIKKQRSTGDINQRVTSGGGGAGSIRSSGSTGSCASDESRDTGYSGGHEHGSFIGVEEFVDPNAMESYMGEWKNDKRSGFGISERSDGLKYEGEWFNNKKYGYGVTTFKDGTKEEGKYKNNVLITSRSKKNLLFVRSSKLRERIDTAVQSASRAGQIAVQKADIAVSRASTAHDRSDQADLSSLQAREDSEIARLCAKQFAPDFSQPGIAVLKKQRLEMGNHVGIVPTYPTKLHTASELMSTKNPYVRSMSAFIPKSHSVPVPPGDDGDATTTTMMMSPDTTPPMQTPPEDIYTTTTSSSTSNTQQLANIHPRTAGGGVSMQQTPALLQQPSSQQAISDHALRYSTNIPQQLPQPHHAPITYDAAAAAAMMNQNEEVLNAMQAGTQRQQQYVEYHQQQLSRQRALHAQLQHTRTEPPRLSESASIPYEHQNAVLSSPPVSGASSSAYRRNQSIATANPVDETNFDYGDIHARYSSTSSARAPMPHHHQQQGYGSPTVSRTPSQSSSRYSVSQMMNDYFDQYSMAANPTAAKLMQQNLMKHSRRGGAPPINWEGVRPESAQLVRRSTLATARDWKTSSSAYDSTNPPLAGTPSMSTASPSTSGVELGGVIRRQKAPMLKQYSIHDYIDNRTSLPDLMELGNNPVQMTREEIARLSSQRRQELQRQLEEAELLRSNPLRYFKYLYHPAVRAWLVRWKLPLIVLLVNVGLTVIFYELLTYSDTNDDLRENDE